MKALLVLVLAAAIAYVFLRDAGHLGETGAVPPVEAGTQGVPASQGKGVGAVRPGAGPKSIECERSDLLVVHGKVEQIREDGVIVNCTRMREAGDLPYQAAEAGQPAVNGWAKIFRDQEMREYGPLLAIEGGGLRPPQFVPAEMATGMVLLQGHPRQGALQLAQGVHVVAAPRNRQTLTMAYVVVADKPGGWMWQK